MSSFPSAFSNSANSYNSKGGHRQELDIFHGLSTREKSESSYQPPGYQAETAIDIESSYTQDNKNKLDFYEPQRQPFNNDIGTDSFNNNNNNINNNSNININNSAPVGTSAQLYGSLSPVPEVQSAADGPEPSVIVGIATRGFSSIKDNIIILGERAREHASSTNQGTPQDLSMSRTRLVVFGVTFAIGILSLLMSFVFFPMLIFSPSTFALLFTSGSFFTMFSFSTFRGHYSFIMELLSRERIMFSLAYFVSLVMTLWATLGVQSYLLTLLFSLVQLISLAYFILSFFPGGTSTLNMLGSSCWSFFTKHVLRRTEVQENTSMPV
eukprot:GHVR01161205.1.p1 GENE.GHVR01161205.1~~GHVR01161205.1.p1  ORF type:complete len:339 (+),score=58.29 GHVR01161205.1:44-1018(+)